MFEQSSVRAGFRSHATRRRAVAIALVVGSISLPLPGRPPATARKVRGSKAARGESVPNYGVIWEGKLTRSGQPRDEEGWARLREQGARSIVNFRTQDGVDYTGRRFGRVLWLPLKGKDPPTDAEAEKFLAFVRDPANWPVHIHCKAGESRTGLMAALVRYAIDGWPLERALAEARTYRGGDDLSPPYVAWLRRWAAAHTPGRYRLDPPADAIY